MKNIWFITNKYFVSNSFLELKKLIYDAAKTKNINLLEYNNVDIIDIMSKNNYEKPDAVLFWDKDVKLAKYIENENIKVFNNSEAIRICDDKSLTYINLKNKNIKMPKTIFSPLIYFHNLYEDEDFLKIAESHLSYPFVLKECFGSFGQQVALVNDRAELIENLKKIDGRAFLLQEFIKTSFGRDLRIYVVGDKIIGAMERINTKGDFRANIEIGAVGKIYEPSEAQKAMALKVVKELNLDFAGVDLLFGEDDEPILCEVNSNAYFTHFNKVLGLNVAENIFEHILAK